LAKTQVIEQVTKILTPILEENNLELWDVELVKEGQNLYLRVYIDKEPSVSLDDCTMVSRFLSKELDTLDPIENPYMLEVSSPGIGRTLRRDKDFLKYIGHTVDIKLYKARDKQKEFRGELISYKPEEDIITIKDHKDQIINFSKKEVAICKLAILF